LDTQINWIDASVAECGSAWTAKNSIQRITAAILAGKRKSGGPSEPSIVAAYATNVADKLPGLFRAGIHKIAAEFGAGADNLK
jgi:hypothetical protein